MADSTDDILKKFLGELGEGFTREDKENIKKSFKGLSVVLENKDDLKKAIETLKLKGEISDEQAAKMQQEAEETRAFRAKTEEYRKELKEDLKSLEYGLKKFNEYQERLYSPTLKAQKELIAMGESVKKGVFAQALSNSLIEGFGKDNNFQKLFGSTNASQNISKGISGLMKGWKGLKEIKALLTKGSQERRLADAQKTKNSAQKEHERLKMRIAEKREDIKDLEKLGQSTEKQEAALKDLIGRLNKNKDILSAAMADEADAIDIMRHGSNEAFEKFHEYSIGSEEHLRRLKKSKERFGKELLEDAEVTPSEIEGAGKTNEQNAIKETQLQQIANEKEDGSGETLEKVVLPEKGTTSQKKSADKKDKSGSVTEGGQLQKMFVHLDDDSVKLEKTKTPNTYPQVVGAFSLWLEEELKDKDDEKKSSKGGSGGKSGGGLADLWAAGSMLTTALTKFGPMLARFGGLLSRLGPMLLHLGPLVGNAALVAGAGVIAYKAGNYIRESWSNWFDEREKKAMEEAKQKEQQERAKMKKDYAEADDEGKAKLAQEYQKENAELAEKQVKAKEKQRKLIEEKNAALASGDTKKAQKLSMKIGELEEEYKEYARKREKYKEIAQKENERQKSKSKSEVDMKKAETGAGKATLEVTKQMAADMHTLVENMPQMVSAGTAAGINNA